jgi:hypothetical protein
MENDPILIPLGHQTPTANLLGLDPIKKLIGHYPLDFFLLLEFERKPPILTPQTPRDMIHEELVQQREATDFLVMSFFTHVHSQHPVLEKEPFLERFDKFLANGQTNDIDAALCLTVLALGEICSSPGDISDMEFPMNKKGADYFAHAYQMILAQENVLFSRDPNVPLTFYFASLYFRYCGRPLQSWKMIHSASTSVQLILS